MNFWGWLLQAATNIVIWFVYGNFPLHQQVGIVNTFSNLTSSTLGSVFMIIFSQINMTIPLITFFWFFALEAVRIALSIWRLVAKKIIPMT
jgi:hypothetical protein